MKAVTIIQPWASLLALGEKQYETRSWKTSHRGKILIHAARKFTDDPRNLCTLEPFHSALAKHGIAKPTELPLGRIVGIAELTDCIPTDQVAVSVAEDQFGDF